MTGISVPPVGGLAVVAELADRVAAAVAACPGVARLVPGPLATHLPHRVVMGVAVRGGVVRVGVVARHGWPLPEVARQVREAAEVAASGWRVDVAIEDIDVPGGRM